MTIKLFTLLAGVLVTLLAAIPAAAAQSDDGSTVEVAILDILLERGLIDQAEYEELLALARARVDRASAEIDLIEGRLARLRAPDVQVEGGSPGKLAFKSADGKWSTELKGWMQARFTDRDSHTDGRSGTNFSVPRARLILAGNAGGEHIKYKFELDASTNSTQDSDLDVSGEPSEQKDARLKDAYIDYGVTESGAIRFGQYKFPFGREELISDSAGQLVEKSLAGQAYAPKREPGIGWQAKAVGGAIEYQFAASNGDGENEPNMVESSALGTGDGLRYGGRVVWYPLGEMKYDTPAFQTLDGGTKMAVGLAYMINKDASFTNTVSAALPSGGTDADTLGLEFQWMISRFSVLAEYFDRTTDPSGAGISDQNDDGFNLQGGFFLVPRAWELVARVSEVDQEDDTLLGAAAAKTQEVVLGVNRYIDGHNGKWMLDYVMLENDTVSGQDEDQIRLQYQLMF